MRIHYWVVCAVLSLAGCASVPKGDAQRDAALKNFMPRSGVAGVYVYRKEIVGGWNVMEVEIDGRTIGRIVDKTYLFAEVAPGPHTILGRSDGKVVGSIYIDAIPGKLYYVKQEPKGARLFALESTLTRMDDIEAQHEIKKTTLAAGQPVSAP